MKILIIDDEPQARSLISNLLKLEYGTTIEIFQAGNLQEGVEQIKILRPKIVYLDIKMPGESGLNILKYFKPSEINFKIIFTTAYNQFAIEAFKLSATDFLIKPIDAKELYRATEKANKESDIVNLIAKLKNLERSLKELSVSKIALEVPKGFIFVEHDDILYFEADAMYSKVHLKNGKAEIVCKPLKYFKVQMQDNSLFFQPHRSYLINLNNISEIKKNDGLYVIMNNGKLINISRDKKNEFLDIIRSVY